jgi:putative membrane protein
MKRLSNILIVIVALLHFGFLALESFFWNTPIVQNRLAPLGLPPEELAVKLASNMGVYNGFLAVGLIWALFATPNKVSSQIFFLVCVIVAGIYGGLTVKTSILMFQAIPAVIVLAVLGLSLRKSWSQV